MSHPFLTLSGCLGLIMMGCDPDVPDPMADAEPAEARVSAIIGGNEAAGDDYLFGAVNGRLKTL
jgi:hypothetical protein